jgi:hypothetical protein
MCLRPLLLTGLSLLSLHKASRFSNVFLNSAKVVFEAVRELTHIT